MTTRLVTALAVACALVLSVTLVPVGTPEAGAAPAQFSVDPVHSAVLFKIKHLGVGYVWGRFNTFEGKFSLTEGDPASCAVEVTIDAASVDTGTDQRDDHLRSPDFFNAKEFPKIAFKSTKVARVEGGFDVTGTLTLHGKTKPVTVRMLKVGEADLSKDMPQLGYRAGFEGKFEIKRSDFGMTEMLPGIGDDVIVLMAFEGVRQ